MKKKMLAIIVLCLIVLNGTAVQAESVGKNIDIPRLDNSLEYADISKAELQIEKIQEKSANVMDRKNAEETYALSQKNNTPKINANCMNSIDGIVSEDAYDVTNNTTSNTDPNNAYVVTNDTTMQGTITATGEMRWYAFSLNEKSKVTILLQMVESLDADLYMYSLNNETYELELIGGSAKSGLGTTEYFNDVLNAGIYFFAVGGYEGTGNFAFANYQSTSDVTKEINDSATSATAITFDSSVSGVIDNPNDIDYYKISVTSPTIIQCTISSPDGYSLLYGGKTGISSAIYSLDNSKKLYKIMPGSYYFAALSENGKYSSTSTYSVNIKKIGTASYNSAIARVGISQEAGIVYETNSNGSVNYVNGNSVDISYSYFNELSNSAGSQSYDISINASANVIALQSDVYEPAAVYYVSSTKPAMYVRNKPALLLTFYGSSNFYKIHVRCTGAYRMNNFWQDLNNVTVLIDPATGKLIDIAEFNYYYDFAPVGSNSITWTRSYNMLFY